MGQLRLRSGEVVVGRDEAAQLRLQDPRLSRRHAVLRREGAVYSLEVLPHVAHRSLVTHNGAALETRRRVALKAGDVVQFGASPAYAVAYRGGALVLAWADETEHGPAVSEGQPVLAFHP